MNATPNATTQTDTHKLVITRTYQASRDRVWRAWTQPSVMQQWLTPGEGIVIESVQMDVRTGGRFRIQQLHPGNEYFTAAGTYLEVTEPEKLVFTWDWEKDGAGMEYGELEGKQTQVTVELHTKEDGRTQLTLTHEHFQTTASRDGHNTGWSACIDGLEAYLLEA